MNKRGVLGEGVLMIYRMMILTFVAFIILGVSSVFYAHFIDVRDTEALIMTREVVECLARDGTLDLDLISEEDKKSILEYCGYSLGQLDRFYVRVGVIVDENEVSVFEHGDSGRTWVLDVLDEIDKSENLRKYRPGFSDNDFMVNVIDGGELNEGKIKVEVFVGDEF